MDEVYLPDPALWAGLIWAIAMLVDVMAAEAFNICDYLEKTSCASYATVRKIFPGAPTNSLRKRNIWNKTEPKPQLGAKPSQACINQIKLQ